MDTTESLGYLKGLIEGLDLGDNKKETKVFSAIVDVLSNLVEDIDDMTCLQTRLTLLTRI